MDPLTGDPLCPGPCGLPDRWGVDGRMGYYEGAGGRGAGGPFFTTIVGKLGIASDEGILEVLDDRF